MNIQVAISGPVLAHLMHDHAASPNNQEGLLFGERSLRRVNRINDHAAVNEQDETIVTVSSFLPLKPFELYNNKLQLNETLLYQTQNDRREEIVGYYSFRRNLPLQATFRDRRVVSQLASHMYGKATVLGLFATSFNATFSVHSMEHCFFSVPPLFEDNNPAQQGHHRQNQQNFEPVSLCVVNLGEDGRQEYRTRSGTAVPLGKGQFSSLAAKLNYSVKEDPNLIKMKALHQDTQNQLNVIARQITEQRQVVGELRQSANYTQRI